jgi:hypothetical protein
MRFHLASLVSCVGLVLAAGCSEGGSVSTEHVRAAPEENAAPALVASQKASEGTIDSKGESVGVLPARRPISFGFVVDVEGEPLVVLRNDLDESWKEWSTAEPTLVSHGDLFVAHRDVVVDALPTSAKQQLGEKVALFDDHGLRCEAVISGLSLIVRADPRMDTRDEWEGKGGFAGTPKATPAEIATEVWSMSSPQLVAHVRAVKGTCGGATHAHSTSLPMPATAMAMPADPATTARVLAFARTTPTFAAIQREFAAETPMPGEPPRPARWEDMPYASTEVVTLRAGSSTYAWITVAVDGGCGDYNARYGALVREDPSATGGFVVVHAPEGGVVEQPRALIDHGDGTPTMLFRDAALLPDAAGYRYDSVTVWSSECPC